MIEREQAKEFLVAEYLFGNGDKIEVFVIGFDRALLRSHAAIRRSHSTSGLRTHKGARGTDFGTAVSLSSKREGEISGFLVARVIQVGMSRVWRRRQTAAARDYAPNRFFFSVY